MFRFRRSPARLKTATLWLLAATPWALGCGAAGDRGAPRGAVGAAPVLTVERGDLQPTFLLTGEIHAETAHPLNVPSTPGQRVQIRWLAEDGSEVRPGERVAEFENSSFSADMEDKRLRVSEAANALERARAEARSAEADARVDVERKRIEVEKARLEAAVPEEILAGREFQDRQLALAKAELELAKAESQLASTVEAQAAEVAVQRVELARVRRDLQTAETTLASLALEAPVGGLVLIGNHPWEERRLQLGDTVWVGLAVAEIPDLSALEVIAKLSDVDEGRVVPGMRARVTPDAYPRRHLEGVVEEVSPVAREVEGGSLLRYFSVRVALDPGTVAEGGDDLLPGMSVKVEALGEPLRDVLLAPRAALDLGADEPAVRAVGSGEARPVRLGPCGPHRCVVEEGVAEGDRLAARSGGETPPRSAGRAG